MEAMLLGGDDDSSSGDSGDGNKAAPPPAAAAPAPPPPATVTVTAPPPAAVPPAPSGGGGGDLNARLKNLYSPAAQQQHRARSGSGPSAVPPPQQHHQQQQAPPPQQQVQHRPPPQHHQSPQQQQHVMPPSLGRDPSSNRSLGGSMSSANKPMGSGRSTSGYQPHVAPPVPPAGGPPPRKQSDPYDPTPVSKMLERQSAGMHPPPSQPPSLSRVGVGGAPPQHRTSSSSYGKAPTGNPPPHLRGPSSSAGPSSVMGPPTGQYRPGGGMSSSSASSSSSRAAAAAAAAARAAASGKSSADREREVKKQKETFLLFTRVLIKYLEQKDPMVHQQVKAIIKDCAERNKRHEKGYESVTSSMRSRLKRVVSENYWQRAEAYLRQLLSQKKGGSSGGGGIELPGSRPGGGAASGPGMPRSTMPSNTPATSSSSVSSQQQQQQAKAVSMRPPSSQQQPLQQSSRSRLPPAPSNAGMPPRSISTLRKDVTARAQALTKQSQQAQQAVQQQHQAQQQQPKTSSTSSASSSSSSNRQGPQSSAPASRAPAPTTKGKSTSKRSASTASKASQGGSSSTTPSSQRRTSGSTASAASAAAAAAAAAEQVEKVPAAILKEYNEYVETLDHAINLKDWTSTTLVLGQKTHATISEEQRQLLYRAPKPAPADDAYSFPRTGWSRKNLVSARNAWAKIRLREKKSHANPASTLALPLSTSTDGEPKTIPVTSWFNEEVAEEDGALAALSEGAQVYMKSILEKAVYCARQRQNVDGVRLWHSTVVSSSSSSSGSSSSSKNEPPPLALRLGCDVPRQVARTEANAALTCKRMEEALERQTDLPARKRVLDNETLEEANSMAEIALRPRLARGVDEAEIGAARANEIAGGKYATQPPLGRIPKRFKLEVIDFQNGQQLAMRPGRHRASVVSGAFSF